MCFHKFEIIVLFVLKCFVYPYVWGKGLGNVDWGSGYKDGDKEQWKARSQGPESRE